MSGYYLSKVLLIVLVVLPTTRKDRRYKFGIQRMVVSATTEYLRNIVDLRVFFMAELSLLSLMRWQHGQLLLTYFELELQYKLQSVI